MHGADLKKAAYKKWYEEYCGLVQQVYEASFESTSTAATTEPTTGRSQFGPEQSYTVKTRAKGFDPDSTTAQLFNLINGSIREG